MPMTPMRRQSWNILKKTCWSEPSKQRPLANAERRRRRRRRKSSAREKENKMKVLNATSLKTRQDGKRECCQGMTEGFWLRDHWTKTLQRKTPNAPSARRFLSFLISSPLTRGCTASPTAACSVREASSASRAITSTRESTGGAAGSSAASATRPSCAVTRSDSTSSCTKGPATCAPSVGRLSAKAAS